MTKLREAVDLQGEWECAVIDISYSQTHITTVDGSPTQIINPMLGKFSVPGGSYCSIDSLLGVLNNAPPPPKPSVGDAIMFDNKDDIGHPIRFQSGTVFVELHFRSVKKHLTNKISCSFV